MRVVPAVLMVMVVSVTMAGTASAQEAFSELGRLLKPGETVIVTDASGVETRGQVEAVKPAMLRLRSDGVAREWTAADVREVHRRHDSLKNGTIIGAIAGGAAGAVAGSYVRLLFINEGRSGVGPLLYVTGLGIVGGMGLGAAIDALIPGRALVYRQERSVSVVPLVAPDVQGVGVRFRF